MEERSLTKKVTTASLWSVASQITQIFNPISLILLVTILSPDDFGLFAISSVIVGFTQIFWDSGVNKALIQREENIEKCINVVFWLNLTFSIVLYFVIFFSAGTIAYLYKDLRLQLVIQIHSIVVVLNSLSSIQNSIFQRQLNFKPIFFTKTLISIIPNMIAIPLAILGFDYWSLIFSMILGAIIQTTYVWKVGKWRPELEFDFRLVRELISFGFWVTAEFLLGWIITSIDEIILGAYLGVYLLGIYRTGKTLVYMLFHVMFGSLPPVMFSAFSRMQKSFPILRKNLLLAIKFHVLLALPSGFGLFLVVEELSKLVFNSGWSNVDNIIGILGLTLSVTFSMSAAPSAYRAIGKPHLQVRILIISLLFSVPTFLVTIQYSIELFLWCQFTLQLAILPLHIFFLRKYFKIGILEIFNQSKFIFLGTTGIFISVTLFLNFFSTNNPVSNLLISIIVGCSVYGIFLLPEKKFLSKITRIIMRGYNSQ